MCIRNYSLMRMYLVIIHWDETAILPQCIYRISNSIEKYVQESMYDVCNIKILFVLGHKYSLHENCTFRNLALAVCGPFMA